MTSCRPARRCSSPRWGSPVAHPLHAAGLATGLARRTGFLRHCGSRQESSRDRNAATHRELQHLNPQAPWRTTARRKSAVRLRTSRAEAACASASSESATLRLDGAGLVLLEPARRGCHHVVSHLCHPSLGVSDKSSQSQRSHAPSGVVAIRTLPCERRRDTLCNGIGLEHRQVSTSAEVRDWSCPVRSEGVDNIRLEVGRCLPPKWEMACNHLRIFGS